MILEELVAKAPGFHSWPHTEKIKLFGWYFHVHKGQKRFSTSDLRACYDHVQLEDPESFNPFFKPLEQRKPKELLKDGGGYYLGGQVVAEFTSRFGAASPIAPISALLNALPPRITDSAERGFIDEALLCIRVGASRAAIVLGWCAVVDRMRRKIEAYGFDKFNAASVRVRNQTSGKFKRWNKEFNVQSKGELQAVFDTDMIVVLEGMGFLDDNQAQRLETLFQYRCHSAHPGDAPIGPSHVISFFTDAVDIVLANPQFHC